MKKRKILLALIFTLTLILGACSTKNDEQVDESVDLETQEMMDDVTQGDGTGTEELNIGGIAQKDPEKDLLVTKSVYLNKEDAMKLKDLNENYGVKDIYFQATPSAPKSSLKDVLKQFDL